MLIHNSYIKVNLWLSIAAIKKKKSLYHQNHQQIQMANKLFMNGKIIMWSLLKTGLSIVNISVLWKSYFPTLTNPFRPLLTLHEMRDENKIDFTQVKAKPKTNSRSNSKIQDQVINDYNSDKYSFLRFRQILSFSTNSTMRLENTLL